MTELIIEVDNHNQRIGLRPLEDFQTGEFIHRSAHLILSNSKGDILIHKRSSNKKWYPNLYTYSASGTVANESFEECIRHEMEEELGISLPVKLLFIYPFFDTVDKSFHALFAGKSNKKVTPNKSEISQIKWVSKDKLEREMYTNPDAFVPHVLFGLQRYFSISSKAEPDL